MAAKTWDVSTDERQSSWAGECRRRARHPHGVMIDTPAFFIAAAIGGGGGASLTKEVALVKGATWANNVLPYLEESATTATRSARSIISAIIAASPTLLVEKPSAFTP